MCMLCVYVVCVSDVYRGILLVILVQCGGSSKNSSSIVVV